MCRFAGLVSQPELIAKADVVPGSGIRGAGGRLSAPQTEVSRVVRSLL